MKERKFRLIASGQHKTDALVPLESVEYTTVKATNYEEAVNLAKNQYQKTYADALNITVRPKKKGRILAIVCLSIACFLGLILWDGQAILRPNIISFVAAIALYSAVIIRIKGLRNSFNSFSEGILSLLTLVFCSSFLNLFLDGIHFKLLFVVPVDIPGIYILGIGIALSWLGIKAIAGLVWVILFFTALGHMVTMSASMGIWGVVYALAAFLGIILNLKEQSAYFLASLRSDMASTVARTGQIIHSDVIASVDAAKEVASMVAAAVTAGTGVPVALPPDGEEKK